MQTLRNRLLLVMENTPDERIPWAPGCLHDLIVSPESSLTSRCRSRDSGEGLLA
jgi:hypothetical protein